MAETVEHTASQCGTWGQGSWGNFSAIKDLYFSVHLNPVTGDLATSHEDIGIRYEDTVYYHEPHTIRITFPPLDRGPTNPGAPYDPYMFNTPVYLYLQNTPNSGDYDDIPPGQGIHYPGVAMGGSTNFFINDDDWTLVDTMTWGMDPVEYPEAGDVWTFSFDADPITAARVIDGYDQSFNFAVIAEPFLPNNDNDGFFDIITNPHPSIFPPYAQWNFVSVAYSYPEIALDYTTRDDHTIRRPPKGVNWKVCPRCGDAKRITEFTWDGEKPSLYVCWECRDQPGLRKRLHALRREREPRLWPRI